MRDCGHWAMLIVATTLLWAGASSAKTPYRSPGDVIAGATHLAVVEIVAVGDRVDVKRLEVIVGDMPTQMSLSRGALGKVELTPGQRILAPLTRVGDKWAFAPSTRSPMLVDSHTERATVAFARAWHADPKSELDVLLQDARHPSPLARATIFGALVRQPRGSASPGALDQMIELLRTPGVPEEDRARITRLVSRLGGAAGTQRLADTWSTLASDRIRMAAAGLFARSATPVAKAALVRCVENEMGALRARCVRAAIRAGVRL